MESRLESLEVQMSQIKQQQLEMNQSTDGYGSTAVSYTTADKSFYEVLWVVFGLINIKCCCGAFFFLE